VGGRESNKALWVQKSVGLCRVPSVFSKSHDGEGGYLPPVTEEEEGDLCVLKTKGRRALVKFLESWNLLIIFFGLFD